MLVWMAMTANGMPISMLIIGPQSRPSMRGLGSTDEQGVSLLRMAKGRRSDRHARRHSPVHAPLPKGTDTAVERPERPLRWHQSAKTLLTG